MTYFPKSEGPRDKRRITVSRKDASVGLKNFHSTHNQSGRWRAKSNVTLERGEKYTFGKRDLSRGQTV